MTAPDEFGNRMPGPVPPIATGDRALDQQLTDLLAIAVGDRTDDKRYALEAAIAARLESRPRPGDEAALLAMLGDQAFDVGKCSPSDEGPGTPATKRARKQAWNRTFGACLVRRNAVTLLLRGALVHPGCDARLAELAAKGSVDREDLLGEAIGASQAKTLALGELLVAALGARVARCKERGSSDSTVKALLKTDVETAFEVLAPLVTAWGAAGKDILEVLAQDIDEMKAIPLDPRWRPILHALAAKRREGAFAVLRKMPREPSDVPAILAAIHKDVAKIKRAHDGEPPVDELALVMLCELGDARALPALLAVTRCNDFGWKLRDVLFPAIAAIGDASAIEPLEAFVAREGNDARLVTAARAALNKLGAQKPIAAPAPKPGSKKPRPYSPAGKVVPPPKTTAAQERAALDARIAKADLPADLVARLAGAVRGAIRIYTRRVADDSLALGVSRFGGLPDLPAKTAWPRSGRVPMMFVAQLRLEELAPYDVDGRLPARGLLAFFIDEERYGAAKVIYTVDPAKLVRVPTPDGLVDRPAATAALVFHTGFELPVTGTREAKALGRQAVSLELPGALELPRPRTLAQVLGYDDYRGYDPEPPKGTRPLFRCDSDDQADLNFGDAQDIAFRITDADLAAARFDRVKLWFQAG